jgi:hypothetical protein
MMTSAGVVVTHQTRAARETATNSATPPPGTRVGWLPGNCSWVRAARTGDRLCVYRFSQAIPSLSQSDFVLAL